MTYIQRQAEAAQAAAAAIPTVARATRRVATLEGQVQRAREGVSRAEGRRRLAGGRLQSSAEVKARARVSDLEIQLHAVRRRVTELGG